MGETENVLDNKIKSLAMEMDNNQPYAYRIVQASHGRVHVYRTKQYKYRARSTEKVQTCATKRQAHAYISKIVNK